MSKKEGSILNRNTGIILKEVANRFGVNVNKLTKLHDSFKIDKDKTFIEKSLYEYKSGEMSFVFRLTIPEYVSFKKIKGEAAWVNYLADNEIRVPRVIPSGRGELVEVIEVEDSSFAVTAFEKVEGKRIDFENADEWNTELIERYGKIMGKIHTLTKRYEPEDKSLIRMAWNEQEWFDIDAYLPESESLVRRKCHDLIKRIYTLPKDKNSYGLIHGDAHPWNILLHMGDLILTDFDFCEYNWFISDIAVALFYSLMAPLRGMDGITFAKCFMKNFMKGYNKENSIEDYWLDQIPTFLRARMISKYVLHYPEWKSNIMSENRRSAFMEWKYKIENDIPYIDINFSEFS